MSDGVNYDVNAWLRTQGSFTREMDQAAVGADHLGASWSRMANTLVSAGERVRGTFGQIVGDFAKGGALAAGGGLVAGIGAAAAEGVKLNDTLEQTSLGLATMYQTFGVAEGLERNVELARAFQHELIGIADASPGTTEDMSVAYQAAAPAMSSVTTDLMRQRDLMEDLATMAWTTRGDYKQMGADFGRILQGQAGGDVQMYQTLIGPISEAFEEVTGKAAKTLGEPFTQQFNEVAKSGGDTALKIMEKVLASVPPEFNAAFGDSFGGVMATVESRFIKLAGDFGKPLFESMKRVMSEDLMGDGPLSDDAIGKFREVAFFSGGRLADAFESGASRTIEVVDYLSNNWESVAATIREAGVFAGVAIKTAIVIGVTRHLVGSAMIWSGHIIGAFDQARSIAPEIGRKIGDQVKLTHLGMVRGMRGQGSGVLGMMGAGVSGAMGRRNDHRSMGLGKLDQGVAKIASLVAVVGSLGVVGGIATAMVGGAVAVVAGATAYFVEHWDRIAGSIIVGLETGQITLVPLITSLYTFYARLEMVGQAIFGGSNAVDTMNGGLSIMVAGVDMVSGALSWFVYGLSIMVGGWGALKIGMLGVMKVIIGIVDVAHTMGAVSDETFDRANRNYQKYRDGVDDTFAKADQLAAASNKIAAAQLSPMDYEKAKNKAKELEKSLMDALAGKSDPNKKGGRAHKPTVKVDKIEIHIQAPDLDPDRLFSIVNAAARKLSSYRTQPHDTLDTGPGSP